MGRILVADDCPETRLLMGIVLEGAGYEVVSASDGREVDKALASGEPFDVFLLDYSMPGFVPADFESKRKAVPSLAVAPVIYVTGHEVEAVRRVVPDAGVLPKPISVDELLALLEQVRGDLVRG